MSGNALLPRCQEAALRPLCPAAWRGVPPALAIPALYASAAGCDLVARHRQLKGTALRTLLRLHKGKQFASRQELEILPCQT